MPFVGWYKSRGSRTWKAVCGASTRSECWQLLLGMISGGDSMVRLAEEGAP